MGRARLRREDGASAVEMALLAPLLFILVFGIIEFGFAFLQVQSIRAAVREGGRAAAVGASRPDVQAKTVAASSGSIPSANQGNVSVSYPSGATNCNSNNIGSDVTVSFPTSVLNSGAGIVVAIPMLPDIHITPTIRAQFRCEV
jgi:Flp pilus assembly protein TadG